MYKTTRSSEQQVDNLFIAEPLVPGLDSICPGWKTAIVHWVDGPDLVFEIGDVFVTGWDITGVYTRPKRKRK